MKRLLSVRSIALALVAVAVLGVLALASAQTLTVEAPPGRLAQPGDYVTLVFLVRSSTGGTLALDATSSHGWQLLGPASTIEIRAGVGQPVAVTVAVPSSAAAGEPDHVTFSAVGGGEQAAAAATIEIARHLDLRLQAPSQVAVGDQLPVTVINSGNVASSATVAVTAGGKAVGTQTVAVAPGKSQIVSFPVTQEARYQVSLIVNQTVLAVRFVETIVHGAPKRSAFMLAGTASASANTNLAWQGSVELKGALSDRASLNMILRGDRLLRSFAELRTQRFGVRLGDLGVDPLGLPAVGGFGTSVLFAPGSITLEGTAGWIQASQFAGLFGLAYSRPAQNLDLTGAVGMRAGALTLAGSMSGTFDGGKAEFGASYDGQRLAANYNMSASDTTGSYRVNFSIADGFTEYGRFNASASYFSGRTSAFAQGTVPLGSEAGGQTQVGASTTFVSLPHGEVGASLAIGDAESYASLSYRPDLRLRVQPSASTGVVYRPADLGWGLSADGRIALAQPRGKGAGWTASIGARALYYPATDALRGRLSASALKDSAPWTLFGSAGWDLGTGTIALNTGSIYSLGNWTVQLDAGGSYAPGSFDPWSAQVQVQGSLAFDLQVPEDVVQVTGGRRLGTLRVHVDADGAPLSGVGLAIGRYRLDTGTDGTLSIQLPPGPVTVAVDLTQLAANLQLVGSGTRTVTLVDRGTADVSFELHRTAAVRGHVLVDSNGDGIADVGAKGVVANLIVQDALGQSHAVPSAPDGSYLVRGLPAGTTTVIVQSTPSGSAVVGPAKRVIDLAAGATAVADFLVRPALARATVFGGPRLRIRGVRPETDAIPPGSAPLVTVTTSGQPDHVTVTVNGSRAPATKTGEDTWTVRVAVPSGVVGVQDFEVRAEKGGTTASQNAELVIRAGAPTLLISPIGLVQAGAAASVKVEVLFDATSVTARLAGQAITTLTETSPGRWQGDVSVPSSAAPGLLDVKVTAVPRQGSSVTQTTLLRVVAP